MAICWTNIFPKKLISGLGWFVWKKLISCFYISQFLFFGQCNGAPAMTMTLKLTLDTNTMWQIIAKRDAGRKCEYIKVKDFSESKKKYLLAPSQRCSIPYRARISIIPPILGKPHRINISVHLGIARLGQCPNARMVWGIQWSRRGGVRPFWGQIFLLFFWPPMAFLHA